MRKLLINLFSYLLLKQHVLVTNISIKHAFLSNHITVHCQLQLLHSLMNSYQEATLQPQKPYLI